MRARGVTGQMCASLKTVFCITGCHLFSLKKHVFTAVFWAFQSSHALEASADFCVNGHLGTLSPELFDCQTLSLSHWKSLFFLNKINLFLLQDAQSNHLYYKAASGRRTSKNSPFQELGHGYTARGFPLFVFRVVI